MLLLLEVGLALEAGAGATVLAAEAKSTFLKPILISRWPMPNLTSKTLSRRRLLALLSARHRTDPYLTPRSKKWTKILP